MDWIVNRARPYIFSTALAPPSAAAAHRGLAVAIAEPERRQRLHALADLLRAELHNCGFDVHRSASAIVPIILGEARTTLERSRQLQAEGLLVPAIRPPSVPEGMARLRISLTAAHSEEDVRKLIEALDRSPPPR